MASAAEQLAANLNFGAFSKATELKSRLWFTLAALIVYRLCTYVPLPGIDPEALAQVFQSVQGGIVGMFNLFSGGALSRMSVVALNIMPYITASIIIQLMTGMSPALAALKKEGESGRKKINQYTRMGTVLLAAIQGYVIAVGLESYTSNGANAVIEPGFFFRTVTVITLVGGTMFLMWLGEQITSRGVGNGISLLIFAGIVAELPRAIVGTLELGRTGALPVLLILLLPVVVIAVVMMIVFIERAQRKVLIQYPKRQVGNKQFQGESSHLPLKLNTAGVIPPIFASSILLFPLTIASFSQAGGPEWLSTVTALLGPGQPLYLAFYVAGIVFFCFFYTAVVFDPVETADNLKRYGGFIPGIRPGVQTADYLDHILTRLTVLGAIYLSFVCTIPELMRAEFQVPFYFGGTSLLIVVSVTMDTVAQIQGHLLAHQYEGLVKKSRLRGPKR